MRVVAAPTVGSAFFKVADHPLALIALAVPQGTVLALYVRTHHYGFARPHVSHGRTVCDSLADMQQCGLCTDGWIAGQT